MNFYGKQVLLLGAHPDDIELGCGALLHHMAKEADVLCVTLSDNQKNPDLRNVKEEHYVSMAILGVPKEKIVFGPFTTRVFPDSRQEILEYFLKLRRDFQPDLIFVHSGQDIHQDHNTMTDEALRLPRHHGLGVRCCTILLWLLPSLFGRSHGRGCKQENRSASVLRNLSRQILLQQRSDALHHGTAWRAGGMSVCGGV